MSGFVYPDCSRGPGETDVILANAGGAHPRILHSGDLGMNRGVNEHGQLSFDLDFRDTVGYVSQPDKLRGKWATWSHETLGLWSGMIVDVRPDPNTGVLDCTAFGYSWQLRKRITPKLERVITGPPGAIVAQVLASVGNDDPLPIAGVDADEVGEPITYQSRGQKLEDVIRAIASRSAQEWYVEPETRRLQWRVQYGRNRSGSVQLVDGVHIVGYSAAFTLEGLTNALFAAPDDERYRANRGQWYERSESIDAYGRLEDSQTYAGAVTKSSIGPIAKADLIKRSRKGRTLQVQVIDVDGCFGWFGVGDTIKVLLSRISTAFSFRVMVQSFKADTRVLTLSGYVP